MRYARTVVAALTFWGCSGETVPPSPSPFSPYSGGFVLTGLTPGVAMNLRASAPGYVDKDTTVTPTSGAQTALLITPSRE
jgi:hypothetical protein